MPSLKDKHRAQVEVKEEKKEVKKVEKKKTK